MALTNPNLNRFGAPATEARDPFAVQLSLSRVHARLVPLLGVELGYEVDPSALAWVDLPADRGFAGYGLHRALRMLLDVLRGLTALHDTRDATGEAFVHGEVTLAQLRVDAEGVCRLVALTRRHSGVENDLLPAEALGHLAPERLLGEKLDVRADVFSVGVFLWEALAGRRLFSEASSEQIIDRLLCEPLLMPQLPPELAWAIPLKAIVARALAVEPADRFRDCAELATAIAIVARDRLASHADVAKFFGSAGRAIAVVEREGPSPTQSSTFPRVTVPGTPRATAPGTLRPGSTLAPLGLARSLNPAPESTRAPTSRRSPFAALLGAELPTPTLEPWRVLARGEPSASLGTPLSVRDLGSAAPASARAPHSSQRAPRLAWAQVSSVPEIVLAESAIQAPIASLATPAPRQPERVRTEPEPARTEPEPAHTELERVRTEPEQVRHDPAPVRYEAEQVSYGSDVFRPKSARRSWSVVAVLAVAAAALVSILSSGSPVIRAPVHAAPASYSLPPGAADGERTPATVPVGPAASSSEVSASANSPNSKAGAPRPQAAPRLPLSAGKAQHQKPGKHSAKDYGI
jgi:serine/threonine-protein kinase